MRSMSRPRASFSAVALLIGVGLLSACVTGDGAHLRPDRWPPDAPFGARELAENFERIALRHEVDPRRPGGEDNWAPSPLKRWEGQVRYGLFGAGATPFDRIQVVLLMERVSGLTGLSTIEADSDLNFLVLIADRRDEEGLSERLSATSRQLGEIFERWRATPEVVCTATALAPVTDPDRYDAALVIISSGLTGMARTACLEEEIVQSLGLPNDDSRVRPSIFNDDGEFSLLTGHDEFLLRILYDPRLTPGMTASEAMPVVRQIAAELDLSPEP